MTEAEEFNRSQAEIFELFDNEDIEFMFEAILLQSLAFV